MVVRTTKDREGIIEAGRRLGEVLEEVASLVQPGVSTLILEERALSLIQKGGDMPAFLDYTPDGASRPYPASLCVSINDEVVHGIPNEAPRTLREGDIVGLDLGLIHEGYVVDSAVTVPVGTVPGSAKRLMEVTKAALYAAIRAAKVGGRIGDISHATEKTITDGGFTAVRVLGGHGVGNHVHEEPWIANVGHPGTGPSIEEGMVLALEPIANVGKATVVLGSDGYTYRTKDGSLSAHFEHTILIEKTGARIVTKRPSEAL